MLTCSDSESYSCGSQLGRWLLASQFKAGSQQIQRILCYFVNTRPQTRGNPSAIYCQKNVRLNFLLTFFCCCPIQSIQSSVFFRSSCTVGAYEEMRCARLGFPRALQVSGSHQGKCRFETPALLQRPVTVISIFCVTLNNHSHTK